MKTTTALALCLCLAAPALAQDPFADKAAAAAARLTEAQMAAEAAVETDRPIASLAAAVQIYEDGLIAARAAVAQAADIHGRAQADLDDDSDSIAELLASLSRISLTAAPPLDLHPDGATASLRAAKLRPQVAPTLQASVAELQTDLAALRTAEAALSAAQETLARGEAGIAEARATLLAAIETRAPLPRRFDPDPVQSALITAQSDTLSTLTDAVETFYGSGLPNDAIITAKGALPLPVTGRILHAFNTAEARPTHRNGITFATPPGALVVTPSAATLLYQGETDSYGTIVVIAPTAGVTMTFAGLATTFGSAGEILPAGTPIGTMGGDFLRSDTNLTTFPAQPRGGASQALYLEVRDGQTPVDPALWFAVEQQVEEQ